MSELFANFYFSDPLISDFSFFISLFFVAFLDRDWKLWLKLPLATLAATGICTLQVMVFLTSLISCFLIGIFLKLVNLDFVEEMLSELAETIAMSITVTASLVAVGKLWEVTESPLDNDILRIIFVSTAYFLILPVVKGVLLLGSFLRFLN